MLWRRWTAAAPAFTRFSISIDINLCDIDLSLASNTASARWAEIRNLNRDGDLSIAHAVTISVNASWTTSFALMLSLCHTWWASPSWESRLCLHYLLCKLLSLSDVLVQMIDFFDNVDIFLLDWLISFKFSPDSYVSKNAHGFKRFNTRGIWPWLYHKSPLTRYGLWVRRFGRLARDKVVRPVAIGHDFLVWHRITLMIEIRNTMISFLYGKYVLVHLFLQIK